MNYGTLLWGFNLNRIENLQKQAIRIISHSYFLSHTTNLFKQLRILKIEDIFILKQLIFYYKFINNSLPSPISTILTKQTRSLRSCHTAFFLKPPKRTNTEIAKKCIRYSIPTLINNYDRTFIENINSLSILTLKKNFKNKTLESYHFECTDQNCYPCIHRFFCSFGFAGGLKFLHIFYYMINFVYLRHYQTSGITSYLNIFTYL